MAATKRYAIQRTYRKNGVLMYELQNINTGKTTYRKVSTVNMWDKRPEFEILTAPTIANVKSMVKKINRKILSYQKHYTQAELKAFADYQSLIALAHSFLQHNKNDTITLKKSNLDALRTGLLQGAYVNAIETLLSAKSLDELLKYYGLDKQGELERKRRYKQAKIPYTPDTRSKYDRLRDLQHFKTDYKQKRNDFLVWWYDPQNALVRVNYYLLYKMYTQSRGYITQDVEVEHNRWLNRP